MPILGVAGNRIEREEVRLVVHKRKRRKLRTFKAPTRRERQTVAEVSRDYARWRKTPAFNRWRGQQWARQDGRCFYCRCDMRLVRVNVEHVLPRSLHGTNSSRNLVLACSDCNRSKASSRPSAETIEFARQLSHERPMYGEPYDPFYAELSWLRRSSLSCDE